MLESDLLQISENTNVCMAGTPCTTIQTSVKFPNFMEQYLFALFERIIFRHLLSYLRPSVQLQCRWIFACTAVYQKSKKPWEGD